MIGDIKKVIILPHIIVQNANALSSPFTIGFPAMSAFLGATHNLQRLLNSSGFKEFNVNATAVISHQANLQTYKGNGDFVHSIIATANSLDKEGKRSPFIEEARIHLDVSLVIEYSGINKDESEEFLHKISQKLHTMRLAGGDIMSFKKPVLFSVKEGSDDIKALRKKLMPGFVLVERRELMLDAMSTGMDAVESLIHYLGIHNSCEKDEENIVWTQKRITSGWIVPIAVGFQGISAIGFAKNQRDEDTPHRFAESIVTLGEFKMPYKIESLDEILWAYRFDEENSLYICEQRVS